MSEWLGYDAPSLSHLVRIDTDRHRQRQAAWPLLSNLEIANASLSQTIMSAQDITTEATEEPTVPADVSADVAGPFLSLAVI